MRPLSACARTGGPVPNFNRVRPLGKCYAVIALEALQSLYLVPHSDISSAAMCLGLPQAIILALARLLTPETLTTVRNLLDRMEKAEGVIDARALLPSASEW